MLFIVLKLIYVDDHTDQSDDQDGYNANEDESISGLQFGYCFF